MNFHLNKKGFTLVEQIAAIAIISIVLVAFTPMFVSYYKNTHLNGTRTTNTFELKEEMDKVIQNPDYRPENSNINVNISPYSTTISNIPNSSFSGRKITITDTLNNITISTFVPDGTPEN